MLIVDIVIPSLATGLFLSTEVGQQALLQQQLRTIEEFGLTASDEDLARFERMTGYVPYIQSATLVVATPLVSLVLAGLLFVVGHVFLSMTGAFKHAFSIVVHVGFIAALGRLFAAPLNYATGSVASPSTLAAFVPMLEADTFAVRFLSAVDVFIVWQMVLLAVGLSVLSHRRSPPIVLAFLLLYALVATVIAVGRGLLAAG